MPGTNEKRRRRGMPRFGLKTLLVLFTIAGVLLGAFGAFLHRARTQRAAVAELRAAEAQVWYEPKYMMRHGPNVIGWGPHTWSEKWEDWLAKTFGFDAVYHVDRVHFFSSSRIDVEQLRAVRRLPVCRELMVTVEDVWGNNHLSQEAWRELCACRQVKHLWLKRGAHAGRRIAGIAALRQLGSITVAGGELTRVDAEEIAGLPGLRSVSLNLVRASDEALKPLGRLTSLKRFSLTHAGLSETVTDRGVAFVAGMKELRSLTLARMPKLTDGVFRFIEPLTELESLNLDQASVRGLEIGRLQNHHRLRELNLIGTPIDDEAMRTIGGLANLRSLDFGGTKVTDKGAQHLRDLTKLEDLSLGRTAVTDAGMPMIATLKKLEELGLRETKVTDRGAELLLGLPKLKRVYLEETRVSRAMKARLSKHIRVF